MPADDPNNKFPAAEDRPAVTDQKIGELVGKIQTAEATLEAVTALGPVPTEPPVLHGSDVRVKELEDAIRRVVTQQADDLCWMDVYNYLAALVGVRFDPAMLPADQMLANCDRYVNSLKTGCPYATDNTTKMVRDYTETRALLKTAGFADDWTVYRIVVELLARAVRNQPVA
jgi:hypothetical protein